MSLLGAYRLFRVRVVEVSSPTPAFIRVVFGGAELDAFEYVGIDQRIKVLLPNAAGAVPVPADGEGDWYSQWLALPDDVRPTMRTYTPRRLERGEHGTTVSIDFAWHEDPGPAAAWAAGAQVGDEAGMVGPNAEFDGVTRAVGWLPPADARHHLIVGDETAFPAIAGILETLDDSHDVQVIVEADDARDVELLAAPEHARVRVLERAGRPHGEALVESVAALADPRFGGTASAELEDVDVDTTVLWEVPGVDPDTGLPLAVDDRSARAYAWLAGEAGAIKRIRRTLVTDRGMPRDTVAFMGYWRHGRPEN